MGHPCCLKVHGRKLGSKWSSQDARIAWCLPAMHHSAIAAALGMRGAWVRG